MFKTGDQVYEPSNPSHHGTIKKIMESGEVCEVEWSFFTDLHYAKNLKLVDQNTPKSYNREFVVPFPTTRYFIVAADESFIDFLGEFQHMKDTEEIKEKYQQLINDIIDPRIKNKTYPIVFIVESNGEIRMEWNTIVSESETVDIETAKQIIEMNWDRKEVRHAG